VGKRVEVEPGSRGGGSSDSSSSPLGN
jgi:hypothetical protein